MHHDGLIAILDDENRSAVEALRDLPEGAFDGPTRLPAWNVKELVAHMWRDVDRIRVYTAEPEPAEVQADGVTYWRAYDPATDSADVADRAKEVADGFATGAALVDSFEANRVEVLAAARDISAERLVPTWGPAMRFDEYLRTRVLEMAVHGLDLADALGARPWLTAGGASVTREILIGLLGEAPALVRRWDDRTFIETGTGRRALTYEEQTALGPLARLFPLLA